MYLFSKAFVSYALERAVKTGAQVIIAGVTVSSFTASDGNAWLIIAQTAGIAVLVSVLTSLTAYSAASGTESTPSTVAKSSSPAPVQTVAPQEAASFMIPLS